jgi:murein DD-endopeptidase MepM/ murein hydrolase activator NlpD
MHPAPSAPLATETSSANGGAFAPALPGAPASVNATPVVPAVRPAVYTVDTSRQVPAIARRKTYTVKSGNSLSERARRRNASVADLQRVNGVVEPHQARPGSLLRTPSSPAGSPPWVEAPEGAHEGAAGEAQQPNIINGGPKQVAALAPTEIVTDGIAAQDEPSPANSAKGAEGASSAAQALPRSKFRWPVKGRVIAGFGAKSDGSHNDGVNIAVPLGADVLAAEAGVVAYAGSELKGYGHLILIRHDNGWVTAYAHNDQILVNRDDKVRRGQVIAKAGKTGSVEQPQVHFEIRQGSLPVDPLTHLE